ncbi:MAG TPA: hypothetical protein VGA37_13670 [Gemmatimonadales bacterium]
MRSSDRSGGTLDEVYIRLNEAVPEFAGLYFDSTSTLVLKVTRPERAAQVLASLGTNDALAAVEGVRSAIEHGRTRFEFAAVSFRELLAWVDSLYMLRPEGMVWLDADEMNNRVAIGVENSEAIVRVEAAAVGLGIPRVMFQIDVTGRPRRQTSLRDRIRPIPGGVKADGALACTIGANAETGTSSGFIISSHCTPGWGVVDGRAFYQNAIGSGNFVGFEVADPPLIPPQTYCNPVINPSCCSAPDGCRYSDAAFVAYAVGTSHQFGLLARPTNFTGSTTINSSKPRFVIGSAPLTILPLGAVVYKSGQAGGARTGTVTGTCFRYLKWFDTSRGDNVTADLLCQTQANYQGAGGDSGGPVFTWDGLSDTVTFRGIHNGLTCDGCFTSTHFSPWRYISLDFSGVLEGLSVSVDGGEGPPGGPG